MTQQRSHHAEACYQSNYYPQLCEYPSERRSLRNFYDRSEALQYHHDSQLEHSQTTSRKRIAVAVGFAYVRPNCYKYIC
jgi:hypothetical protein